MGRDVQKVTFASDTASQECNMAAKGIYLSKKPESCFLLNGENRANICQETAFGAFFVAMHVGRTHGRIQASCAVAYHGEWRTQDEHKLRKYKHRTRRHSTHNIAIEQR